MNISAQAPEQRKDLVRSLLPGLSGCMRTPCARPVPKLNMGAYRFSLPGCPSQRQIVTASCAGNCGAFLLKICAATVAGANARSPWLQILLTLISGVMRCAAAAMKEAGMRFRLSLECASVRQEMQMSWLYFSSKMGCGR